MPLEYEDKLLWSGVLLIQGHFDTEDMSETNLLQCNKKANKWRSIFLPVSLALWRRIIKAAGKPSETREVSVIFETVGV